MVNKIEATLGEIERKVKYEYLPVRFDLPEGWGLATKSVHFIRMVMVELEKNDKTVKVWLRRKKS